MTNKVLVIGAGRSSNYLIDYLAKAVQTYQWELTIADISLDLVNEKLVNYPHVKAKKLDILDEEGTQNIVSQSDIIISLLPASFQAHIATHCLALNKSLLTASYLPSEIKEMNQEVRDKGLLFLNELGLDPGIDHMSAMQMIDRIKANGGKINAFRSFAGALIAPESDTNPWHYKFTWNPRNVVLAGQGSPARYMENNQYKYIPYHQLFQRTQPVYIEGQGAFEGYANRDSLTYRQAYGLEEVPTILRGTLRKSGYCAAWNALVQLGLTENSFVIEKASQMTYADFTEAFLEENTTGTLVQRIARQTGITEGSEAIQMLQWLGLLEKTPVSLAKGTPAEILQHVLEEKWRLEEQDKDMIVMQHQLEYTQEDTPQRMTADMVVFGENIHRTSIAKTVGLPLAIATKLILQGKISLKGVHLPTSGEIYDPVLKELEEFGIEFREKVR